MANLKKTNKRKRNKRGGIDFLGEYTFGIVVAVICLVILIFIAVKIYGIFSDKTELEKAENTFKQIKNELQLIKTSPDLNSGEIIIYPPDKWILRGFTEGFPKAECYGKASCLCLCKEANCNTNVLKVCEGFEFKILINSEYGDEGYSIPTGFGKIDSGGFYYNHTIAFLKSVEGLKIYKQEDLIVIERVETE